MSFPLIKKTFSVIPDSVDRRNFVAALLIQQTASIQINLWKKNNRTKYQLHMRSEPSQLLVASANKYFNDCPAARHFSGPKLFHLHCKLQATRYVLQYFQTMCLTPHQYYICNWVGFTFGLLSLLLSLLTLIIIYLSRKKTNIAERKVHENADSKVENPMNLSISTSDNSGKTITDRPTTSSKTISSAGELKATKFNGYLLLIASTTICQCLYDINYILGITNSYSGCVTWHFLDLLGGMSVTIWTNVLSFAIYYVVTYIRSVV